MNRNDRRIAIAALILGVLALVGLFVVERGMGPMSPIRPMSPMRPMSLMSHMSLMSPG